MLITASQASFPKGTTKPLDMGKPSCKNLFTHLGTKIQTNKALKHVTSLIPYLSQEMELFDTDTRTDVFAEQTT